MVERKQNMTQFHVNKAYAALTRLADLKLPVKKAYELYKLSKAIEEHYNFAVSQERKYIDEFSGKINPDGTVSFENTEKFSAFQDKLSNLNEMNVELDITPISLTEKDLGDQTITPAEIYSLEGFVSFE
jgi:hypothetical protein